MPKTYGSLLDDVQQLKRECADKQFQIDNLMLEYCPEEMTPEQFDNWKNNQRPSPNDK